MNEDVEMSIVKCTFVYKCTNDIHKPRYSQRQYGVLNNIMYLYV